MMFLNLLSGFLKFLVDNLQCCEKISQEQDKKRQGQHKNLPLLTIFTSCQAKQGHRVVELPKVAKKEKW